MQTVSLCEFITTNRDEIIGSCRAKAVHRSPEPAAGEIDRGVPMFLGHLLDELCQADAKSTEISTDATRYGRQLHARGFTVSQVVHDYGDVCQAVTELALEKHAPIATEDFRTLNRCLDDAIASAVTGFAGSEKSAQLTESAELRFLTTGALAAFEIIQTGTVGAAGRTGQMLLTNLQRLRALTHREAVESAKSGSPAPTGAKE